MTSSGQKLREFWIRLSSTTLLNNRMHYAYDKEMHDEMYYNDGESYDEIMPKTIHVREVSPDYDKAIEGFVDVIKECAKHKMLAQEVDTMDRNQTKIYWTNITIKAREALAAYEKVSGK